MRLPAGHTDERNEDSNDKKRDRRDTWLSRFVDAWHKKARQACSFPVALCAPIVALFSKTVALMRLSMSRFPVTIEQTGYVAIPNSMFIVTVA